MFDVMTFNLQHGTRARAARRWLDQHVPDVDVFAGMEMNNRGSILARLAAREGFALWQSPPEQKAARSVPVLARESKFRVLGFGADWLSDPEDVGPAGAGPSELAGKWLSWMRLRERHTGHDVTVAACHLVPSVYLGVRDRLHEAEVRRLAHAAVRHAEHGPVLVVGDMNVEPDHPNMRPLRSAGMVCVNAGAGPSHGRRLIDHMWTLGDVECVGVRHGRALVKRDHRPTVGTFRLGR